MRSSTDYTHKYHPQPRLSASQIAEYLPANATNRKRILKEAKYPPTALLIRYEDAKSALIQHLASRSGGDGTLDRKILNLRRKAESTELTDHVRTNCNLCIEAIESFQSHEARFDIGKAVLQKPGIQYPRLKISNVNISVSIDLRVEQTDVKGGRFFGGAMLLFSKSRRDEEALKERTKAMTLLIHELLKSHTQGEETLDPKLCMVIDVFSGVVYRARTQQRLLYKTVENSCGEVASIWPSVTPPTNYFGPTVPNS